MGDKNLIEFQVKKLVVTSATNAAALPIMNNSQLLLQPAEISQRPSSGTQPTSLSEADRAAGARSEAKAERNEQRKPKQSWDMSRMPRHHKVWLPPSEKYWEPVSQLPEKGGKSPSLPAVFQSKCGPGVNLAGSTFPGQPCQCAFAFATTRTRAGLLG